MILATAGHVDHGKTSLIRRLTGVDTDRLAEEKARGLTIDLGFAYKPLPSGVTMGVVDVPGHERFISNMLAGVGAIDCALLVIAADDGPMPQTREHLAILDMLGIESGVVALTKVDRVDIERLEEAILEVQDVLAGTGLEGVDIFPVSSLTGEGLPQLEAHLEAMTELFEPRARRGHFRMTVDRCFTIAGAGVVVTGAGFSGEIENAASAVISPTGTAVRVRGLRALNEPAQAGHAGERIALNLTGPGVQTDRIRRGDWIVAAQAHHPSSQIDARLRVAMTEEKAFRNNSPVHFHFGAQDVPARVAILERGAISPGESALVRISLKEPTLAVHGDRFVLRDQSAQRTIAGGSVLDPFGPIRGRARADRLAVLQALDTNSPSEALAGLLALPQEEVDLRWFGRAFNLRADEADAAYAELEFVRAGTPATPFAITTGKWSALKDQALDIVVSWQRAHPDSQGLSSSDVFKALSTKTSKPVLATVLASIVADGRLRQEGQLYFVPGSRKNITAKTRALDELIVRALREGGVPPPTVHEISARTALAPNLIFGFLNRATARGLVCRVGEKRFFLSDTVRVLAKTTEELGNTSIDGWFKASDFRDRTGIGRRPSVELLEYFDDVGFTVRDGDQRRVAKPAAALFGA